MFDRTTSIRAIESNEMKANMSLTIDKSILVASVSDLHSSIKKNGMLRKLYDLA